METKCVTPFKNHRYHRGFCVRCNMPRPVYQPVGDYPKGATVAWDAPDGNVYVKVVVEERGEHLLVTNERNLQKPETERDPYETVPRQFVSKVIMRRASLPKLEVISPPPVRVTLVPPPFVATIPEVVVRKPSPFGSAPEAVPPTPRVVAVVHEDGTPEPKRRGRKPGWSKANQERKLAQIAAAPATPEELQHAYDLGHRSGLRSGTGLDDNPHLILAAARQTPARQALVDEWNRGWLEGSAESIRILAGAV